MLRGLLWIALTVCCIGGLAFAQESEADSTYEIAWEYGPTLSKMGDLAEITVPEGYLFAGAEDTKLLMTLMGNPVSETEQGFFSPDSMEWFAVFEFDEVGYIKDDEKESLDPEGMLESIREAQIEGNKRRREMGYSGLEILGWANEPHYDAATNNLEWAIRMQDDEGNHIINHNTRILGRRGVMRVTLVVNPESLDEVLPLYKNYLDGFAYQSGEKYAEFREGDKIAEYGLSALVLGGAAAVAAKSGLLKHLWKLIAVGIAAIGGFFKKFFGKKEADA